MSQQINPVAVRDVVLDLDDKVNFAVYRSGQNISVQRYPANSATNSQHVYAIQVPSISTILSRNIVWGSRYSIEVSGTVGVGEYLVNLSQVNYQYPAGGTNPPVAAYGADCLAPFPLNSLCSQMSITINNTQVSLPVNQVLDPLLRAVDKKHFARWNGTTPTQLDKYGNYFQALPQQVAGTVTPTGGTPVIAAQQYLYPTFNSPFNTYDAANCNNNEVPRGAFKVISVTEKLAGGTVVPQEAGTAANEPKVVTITLETREPLFVSPFLYGDEVEAPGLSGITQINVVCQMDAAGKRVLRWVNDAQTLNKRITNITYEQAETYMECVFYTPKPSDMIPATIVTPLQTFTQYQLPPTAALPMGAAGSLTSNSIQLNSYPDKIFIWVDNAYKWQSNPTPATPLASNNYSNGVADAYASITGVTITLNNQSGILSTFDATQLFRASVKSGSQQTWDEFSGLQTEWDGANTISVGNTAQYIQTCGSVLMLNFGDIINISQDYLAPGSLATCQFQVTVYFKNNLGYTISPQLNLLTMNSGILSTANGASSAYSSGVLTKENVLNAAMVPKPMNSEKLARYVGGGLRGSLKSIATSLMPFLKRELLAPAVENLGKMATDRLTRKLKA